MRKMIVLGMAASLGFLSGCGSNATVDSTDVNEDKIFQAYHADFDAGKNRLLLEAKFTLGDDAGTTIRLKDPSQIAVNETPMVLHDGDKGFVKLLGTYYTLEEMTKTPKGPYTFQWTRSNGQVVDNPALLPKPVTIASPASDAELKRTESLTVTVAGDAFVEGELIRVSLEADHAVDGKTGNLSETVTSGKQVIFSKADMARLAPGRASIGVVRERSGDHAVGSTVGGCVESSWHAAPVSVLIVN
jgi:hypothetical protein